jgi:hypothetical protein
MINLWLPERSFIPELDEIPITPGKIKKVIEELENYNRACRLWYATDDAGNSIPERYRGRNRYHESTGEGLDDQIGAYTVLSIYDLDPESASKKVLIARYRIANSDGSHLQTKAQAEKHIKAARLNAEREERQIRKDPALQAEIKVKLPTFYSPEVVRRKINAELNPAQDR